MIDDLKEKGFIKNMEIPSWGHTYKEPDKFVITYHGEQELERLNEHAKTSVRTRLEPGVHSKWSGVFNDAGFGRDGFGSGRLYFDFKTPVGERVRVYSDTGEFERL